MTFKNFAKAALIFGAGFAAGAYYVYKRLKKEIGEECQAYADEQIAEMRSVYTEKAAHMDEIIEEKSREKGIEFALNNLNLQDAAGNSIYDTTARTYELIPPDEFAEIDEYESTFLTYYKDGTLAYDQGGMVVDDPIRVVGPNAIDNIGKYAPDMIHVRNHLYRKDYEILRSEETYEERYGVKPDGEDDD